jgi:GTP cyclohydrolase I
MAYIVCRNHRREARFAPKGQTLSKKTTFAGNVAPLPSRRPSRQDAEQAVRTLLAWAGDDPSRAGLVATPERVVDAYREYFSGYEANARDELNATFEETTGYNDMVLLKGIYFESHCEHHIAPFSGVAHVAYIPSGRIVGLSKLARVVEIYARRLQTQENMTSEVAGAIDDGLQAQGVAVMISAEHKCMSARGVRQPRATTITSKFTGTFEKDAALRERFMSIINASR